MSDVTQLLHAMANGDSAAAAQLFPLVYGELNRLAAQNTAQEKSASLCASDLVHEAYLRLAGPNGELSFENRRHLFGAAAQAMRRILIDAARRRHRAKRGGAMQRVEPVDIAAPDSDETLLALDQSMNDLTVLDPLAANVVDLHHFSGLSHEKTAEVLGLSVYKVRQKWTFARAWLSDQLK